MKIMQLEEKIKEGKLFEDLGIEVKKYLPFVEKTLMVEDLIEACIEIADNNMKKINYVQKQLHWDLFIIMNYTNIELDAEDITGQYDFLKENGIIASVIDKILREEYRELELLFEESLNQEKNLANSIEGVIANSVQSLIAKIPEGKQLDKWINKISKTIKDFDPSKYSQLQDMLKISKGE